MRTQEGPLKVYRNLTEREPRYKGTLNPVRECQWGSAGLRLSSYSTLPISFYTRATLYLLIRRFFCLDACRSPPPPLVHSFALLIRSLPSFLPNHAGALACRSHVIYFSPLWPGSAFCHFFMSRFPGSSLYRLGYAALVWSLGKALYIAWLLSVFLLHNWCSGHIGVWHESILLTQ